MRSSRVSRDTAKLFDKVSSPPSPPRRTTRSSLARFAYTATTTAVASQQQNGAPAPDVEDIFTAPAKKRRRVASTTSPVKVIKTELVEDAVSVAETKAAARRVRKPARKVTNATTGEVKVEPPSDWEEIYGLIRQMRAPGGAAHGAAVDTMGCERLADRSASEKDQRFHTLVALMLSSQTKDTVNAVAMKRLQTELPPYKEGAPVGLNLDNMLAVDPKLLNEMIWAVGFHNNKTKYLKQAAEILRDKWDGDIPDTIEGLTSLPGVGPKMGYLCLSVAWNRTEGIGVDVHVHRITNLWGWNNTKNPEETRLALQSWLPKDRWREINSLLVGLGQKVCLPQGRRCGDCEVGLRGLCKAADRKKLSEGRRIRAEMEHVQGEDALAQGKKEEVIKTEFAVKQEEVE
ncbi:unnamed protein product [Clonostachys rosea f. rosea IK726]|uniref:Endonuclease III homolog n=2 Tax=Bionectria ochroleuca TaxID=29856 RepID=A0A0B7KFZ7_BIOOC|nr:unnamed protein product [Clonostachys rosea f. rosea IK726]